MRLVVHQLRFEFKRFWRDPQSVFFTVALPIVFLVIFAGIFGNETLESRGNLKVSTYYVPGIIALGVMSAGFVGLAISIVEQRERGILKRLRSTPLPPRVYIAGRAGTAAALSLLVTVALVLVGRLAYGVRVPVASLPGLLVTLVLGTACFACLGFAVSGVIRSANSAPAVTNGIALPLQMISGIFFPIDQLPAGLLHIAQVSRSTTSPRGCSTASTPPARPRASPGTISPCWRRGRSPGSARPGGPQLPLGAPDLAPVSNGARPAHQGAHDRRLRRLREQAGRLPGRPQGRPHRLT